ncbi:MAG TPA: hypothetical protein VJY62_02445 [Bacteroidia bacterium]|nr:hypothetical protein [Bacteroidia bacterium]
MTNNLQLYSYHLQILQDKGTVRYVANATKYDAFYRRNGRRVEELLNKICDLQEEYFETENKEVKMKKRNLFQKIFRMKPSPVMKPGKKEVDFNKAFNKLMEEKVQINL